MPRVKTPSICQREECGKTYYRWSGQVKSKYCSQQCWLKEHNTPERNAQVARATINQRADMLRGRGEGKSYPKLNGRHAHRVIAEKKIGRPLRRGEIVHHEDENRLNYDENNLEVLASQSEHMRLHWKKKRNG